jgi:NADPH:quinone reductase-like Zn-dependent oxidoreductase
MKAVVMKSFGGPEVLQTTDIPVPAPNAGEILIQVHAAGINPVDYKIRSGEFHRAETKLPAVLGRDVSGTIAAIGRGVSNFDVGDEVYAFLESHSGGYADYAIAKDNEVSLKPVSLNHVEAAAVPLAATTAWQALFDHGKLRRGQRVLIHGAAGGVGHFAVQFAKVKEAVVIATAGADDISFVEELGADQVIDYKNENFENEIEPVDLVIDLIAGDTQERSWSVLKDGGAMISTLKEPSASQASQHHARAKVFMAQPKRETLREIALLIDEGHVRVVLQKTYPLSDAGKAQDELEHDHSAGKRVLVMAE